MAIRTVVTRGYGNGTFSGTIALVALRGYASAVGATLIGQWSDIEFIHANRDRTAINSDRGRTAIHADRSRIEVQG